MDGAANVYLNDKNGGSNFKFTVPFEIKKISVIGADDCVSEPNCDIFSATNAVGGHYRSVFDYSNLASSSGAFTRSGDARTTSNHLELVNTRNEKGSSFTNTQYNMLDSFELQFDFEIAEGYDCGWTCIGPTGRADGFAFVIHNQGASAIGSSGDPGQGYKNFPGKSFAVVVDSYGAGTADRTIRFAFNGNLEDVCNNPLYLGCTSGYVLKVSEIWRACNRVYGKCNCRFFNFI